MPRRSDSVKIYGLTNYSFGTKEPQLDEDTTNEARMARLASDYERDGCRRSVEAVLLVHEHGYPHILALLLGNAFFRLPGDVLRAGEGEVDGLVRILNEKLAPDEAPMQWNVGECLCQWYRPNVSPFMYP